MHARVIASNTFYQFITKFFTSTAGFIITILLAGTYGAQTYGEYIKITTFVSFFYILCDFGLNAIFLQLPQRDARFNYLLSLRLTASLVIVILVNALVFLLSFQNGAGSGFPPPLRLSLFLFSLTIICQAAQFCALAIFQKKLRYNLSLLSFSIGTGITALLIALFSNKHLPLEYIFFAYLIGAFFAAILSLLLTREKLTPLVLNKDFSRNILLASYPLGLMLFLNLIYFRADVIILSFFKSTIDVAIYGYALKYFEFLLAIPVFLANSIYPFLLDSSKNTRNMGIFSQNYLLVFLISGILIALLAWAVSPLIALVQQDFLPSVSILRLLILSLPIFFVTSILQWILISQKRQKYLLKVYFFGAIVNVFSNVLFIPTYGPTGAAVVTGLSECVILILLFLKLRGLKHERLADDKIYES